MTREPTVFWLLVLMVGCTTRATPVADDCNSDADPGQCEEVDAFVEADPPDSGSDPAGVDIVPNTLRVAASPSYAATVASGTASGGSVKTFVYIYESDGDEYFSGTIADAVNPAIAYTGTSDDFGLLWVDDGDVKFQIVTPNGLQGNPITIVTGGAQLAALAFDPSTGTYGAVW